MPQLRPLPARPSLAFERKEAKALRRRLRAGDSDAIARALAHHSTVDVSSPDRFRLADAQLVIAREYGFASWPKLVRYFGDVARQSISPISDRPPDFYDAMARSLLAQHRHRQKNGGRAFAAYVPRFYGKSFEEVFASEVTEAEARLAAARMHGFPSWEVLRERTTAEATRPRDDWEDPIPLAARAMAAADVDALRRIAEAHPELLHPTGEDERTGHNLMNVAIGHERRLGVAAMRPVMEWLAAQGLDLQRALNVQLCVRSWLRPDDVRYLLDRGADPNWVAPNGIPVLEHALLRHFNPETVDVLAARATPRRALWIAAGLGDVDGVRRFLDPQGRPTRAARRLRPDWVAVGKGGMPLHPDPDDEEILMEAFSVAAFHRRTAVLEYLASRGFDVNSLVWETPVLNLAAGNGWTAVVECLVRCGANPNIKGRHPDWTAREYAQYMLEQEPANPERRRIAELCGLDPDPILAEWNARPVTPPALGREVELALELASDDAARLGQADIGLGNLLFGLLRARGAALQAFTLASRMDLERFRADMADRMRPAADRLERPRLPVHPEAEAVIQAATAIAAERRPEVEGQHLLYALTRAGRGAAADLLVRYGSSAAALNAELEKRL